MEVLSEEEKQDQAPKDSTAADDSAESEDKPEPKPDKAKPKKEAEPGSINISKGALGRGRFSKFVSEAGARASGDSKGLMTDLGIKSAAGATDLQKVNNILQRAVNFNEAMREAYAGAFIAKIKLSDESPEVEGVQVSVADISQRDGIKFISHTLIGAQNAGMLDLDGGIEIGNAGTGIFIHSV